MGAKLEPLFKTLDIERKNQANKNVISLPSDECPLNPPGPTSVSLLFLSTATPTHRCNTIDINLKQAVAQTKIFLSAH
jgi:hypothetical protein